MSLLNDCNIVAINDLLQKDFSGWLKSKDSRLYLQEFETRFAKVVGARSKKEPSWSHERPT